MDLRCLDSSKVLVLMNHDDPLSIVMPKTIELQVVDVHRNFLYCEHGIVVQYPVDLKVNVGQRVKVSTESEPWQYLSRA